MAGFPFPCLESGGRFFWASQDGEAGWRPRPVFLALPPVVKASPPQIMLLPIADSASAREVPLVFRGPGSDIACIAFAMVSRGGPADSR